MEEDRLKQMPKNYAKKRHRLEAEYAEDQRREAAEAEVLLVLLLLSSSILLYITINYIG